MLTAQHAATAPANYVKPVPPLAASGTDVRMIVGVSIALKIAISLNRLMHSLIRLPLETPQSVVGSHARFVALFFFPTIAALSSNSYIVFRLHLYGILQNPFKHSRRSSNEDRTEGDDDAHDNRGWPVITFAQQNEDFFHHDKTDDSDRAICNGPQSLHSLLREYFVLSGISEHLECLIERHKKRNGPDVYKRYEWIGVHLKERGMRIHTFEVGFPEQKGKSADTNEYNDCLKKSC